jgi:hypothetical protein
LFAELEVVAADAGGDVAGQELRQLLPLVYLQLAPSPALLANSTPTRKHDPKEKTEAGFSL